MKLSIPHLERLAEEATQGEWRLSKDGYHVLAGPEGKGKLIPYDKCDQDFIAACNPANILTLLSALKVMKEALGYYADEKNWYLHKDKNTGAEVRRSIEYFDTESSERLDDTENSILSVTAGKTAKQALSSLKNLEF